MQFHNTSASRYHAPMLATTPGTILGRLRASVRVTVLVLLVFAMKIGLAAACAKHDFADLGLTPEASQQSVSAFADTDDGNNPLEGQLPHAGACTHCDCHHAAAVPVSAYALTSALAPARFGYAPDAGHSAPAPLELRPPHHLIDVLSALRDALGAGGYCRFRGLVHACVPFVTTTLRRARGCCLAGSRPLVGDRLGC